MTTSKIFVLIFLIYLLGFFAHALFLRKTVYGDGIFYYSWLRSVVIDRDLDFRNEYAHFNVTQPVSRIGLIGNKYSIGPGLLWSPAFLWIHSVIRGGGYEFPYQLAIGVTGVLLTILSLILLYRLLLRFFPQGIGLATVASIALATNLFFYGALDTVNSHALSFFTVTVFLSLLFQKQKSWFLLGLTLALIGLERQQDLIWGLLLIPAIIWVARIHQGERVLPKLLKVSLGFFFGFLPQFFAWQLLYGNFWQSPYLGGNESFNFLQPHIIEVLFSPTNGLFLWTPITVLGLIGLFLHSRDSRNWRILNSGNGVFLSFFLVFLIQLLIVASWSSWNQGASYSSRMFVSNLPLLAFGLANFYQWLTNYHFRLWHFLFIFILPLGTINSLLMIYFLIIH